MAELLNQIVSIARGMWKYRWLGMLAAWVVAAVGTVAVFIIPDKYEANARIFVDTQSILKPLMSGLAVQPNVEQQVVMLSKMLITRPNMEKLVRMADLDLGNSTKEQQEGLIQKLTSTIQIKNSGRDNLYFIAYTDPNPDKAKRVVQSLVSLFIESSMSDSRKGSDDAKKFIDEQIKTVVAKLEEAENRLKEFKLRNIDLQTQDGKDMAGRIGDIGNQLNQAKLELREAENAREAAKRQLDNERANANRNLMSDTPAAVPTPEIDARIEAVKRNLDGLLQRFTEAHPDVINARKQLKELDEVKRKEVAELRKAAQANPVATTAASPALQELTKMYSSTEVQVASLKARVAEYESRYAKARAMLKTAPQIEAELAQLNRDYNINKKNYEDLVARRESANLSGELDNTSGIADFRLIDPPRVLPQPVAPNRLLLLPLVLLVSIGAGLAFAFAGSQVKAVFHDAHSLHSVLGLPLLGVVTLVVNDATRRLERRDLQRFLGATGGLVVLFGMGITVLYILSTKVA